MVDQIKEAFDFDLETISNGKGFSFQAETYLRRKARFFAELAVLETLFLAVLVLDKVMDSRMSSLVVSDEHHSLLESIELVLSLVRSFGDFSFFFFLFLEVEHAHVSLSR